MTACASASSRAAAGHDWTRFGWNAVRSSAPSFATGITAGNVKSLGAGGQLDGTVDSSPIYLHGVRVGGATHDVFFVTTTYGKTEAVDAKNGSVPLALHAAGYASWAGTAQITTATPVADPEPLLDLRGLAGRSRPEARRWPTGTPPGGRASRCCRRARRSPPSLNYWRAA